MTILVADNIASVGLEALEEAGHHVVDDASLNGDALVEALGREQPNILIVRSTKVTPEALDASPALSLIVRAGAGYDTIDVEGASARGIYVANCPGKNSVAVAELTIGLIVSIDRRIPDNVADARDGKWNKKTYAKAEGLKGQTIGVVGLGNIGEEVVRRAQAFDLDVVAWSRSLTPERAEDMGIGYCESAVDVARSASIVTLHVASTPETKHLADRSFFEALPKGSIFINTTRAAVVDEDALKWALEERGLRAGLDVFHGEPAVKQGSFESELAGHPNVYITHHIGASTQQAQDATALEAARVANTFSVTGDVPNCVNLASQSPATHQITVRHLDEVGVLARVLDEMSKADWNIQEMENEIFSGAKAAVATMRFNGDATDDVAERIEQQEKVLAVSVIEL
ncbi:hydroxyacid dehydrogenase [Longibacter salinarum]|uniref:D-3-phosphoglycerate dehydrogenase n=1 Tax=Longibacter salinarum TaxID=1850348 RepID=A0A2A8D244_9BACT|nr:phosphoglycerate dehydrogenase [Longibacter salinarum]PEN15005.1 hydroxyacid dehydrogenase [Longibacter salinarum]